MKHVVVFVLLIRYLCQLVKYVLGCFGIPDVGPRPKEVHHGALARDLHAAKAGWLVRFASCFSFAGELLLKIWGLS